MFNPREEAGEVYRMIRDKRAKVVHLSALTHPNVVKGEDVIPGAITRAKTIQRINKWTRPLLTGEEAEDSFDLPEYLYGQTAVDEKGELFPPLVPGKYKIENTAFSYMVLGRYPAQSSRQLISREWVMNARSRWDSYVSLHGEMPPAGTRPKMGLDVAEFGDDSSVAIFRYGGWIDRPIAWSGVDRVKTSERATVEYKQHSAFICNVDASGIGMWIAPNMDGCNSVSTFVGTKPTIRVEEGEFKSMRCQIWWLCREWLRTDPGAMLPPDELLLEELLTPSYNYTRKGTIEVQAKDTMRERLKRSPDRADALCLTFAPSDNVVDSLDVDGGAI
jgi:hypothetical protein